MFFMKLRRGAKPVFILLAVVFAGSFIFLGVGSGNSGLGDVFAGLNFGRGTGADVGGARERVRENPNDPAAYRALATAFQTDGKPDEAIAPLERYTKLRPRDADALRELAALRMRRANEFQQQAQLAQLDAGPAYSINEFNPDPNTPLGQALGQDPITQAITTAVNEEVTEAYSKAQQEYAKALREYRAVTRLLPRDAPAHLELAQTAEAAGDARTAIAAYQRFVELAPDDPTTPQVKQRIEQLQSPQLPPGVGS